MWHLVAHGMLRAEKDGIARAPGVASHRPRPRRAGESIQAIARPASKGGRRERHVIRRRPASRGAASAMSEIDRPRSTLPCRVATSQRADDVLWHQN